MFLWVCIVMSQCSSAPEYILRCIATTEQHGTSTWRCSTAGEFGQQRRAYMQVTREKSNIFTLRWNFFARKYLSLYSVHMEVCVWVFGEGGKEKDGVFCHWNFWCKKISWDTLFQRAMELLHLPTFHETWFGNLSVCLLSWSIRLLPFLW